MVRRPMKKHPIDTAWFLKKMEDAGQSMHTLAPKIQGLRGELDYAALYRMIHGERAMSLSEAVQLAEILKAPIEIIAKKALGKR